MLVFNLTDLQDWEPLLERLYNGLYMESFPDPDEREELAEWQRRLTSQPEPSDPLTATFVIGTDLQKRALVERKIQGFLTVELYRESRCGLASYIAIEPTCRGRGWARLLFREAKKWLKERCQKDTGENLRALFAEVHDPHEPSNHSNHKYPVPLDPYQRLEVMGRLGAKWVGLPYWQPPLAEGRNWVAFLLLAFPLNDGSLKTLPVAIVWDFLHEYYRALEIAAPKEDTHFQLTFSNVKTLQLLKLLRETKPVLSFREYSIAIHFLDTQSKDGSHPDEVFESFETDLLSFSRRADAPFTSRLVSILHELKIVFPEDLCYQAEGETKKLLSGTRRRHVWVSASKTVFHDKDKTAVLHLVFTPDGRDGVDRAIMNEWDLVKLIKFWESGEGVDGPGVKFDRGNGPITLGELVKDVFVLQKEPRPWCGTVQLLTSSETTPDWNGLYKLFSRCHEGLDENEVSPELIAVAGVIQGLLDFPFVDKSEVADVFQKEFRYEDSMLLGIHKGTLFEFTSKCRVYDKLKENVGANPYLLLPNTLLCYNDYLLREAERKSEVANRRIKKNNEEGSAQAIRFMRSALQDRFLGNVFHYPTERFLYDCGMQSRGLLDFKEYLLSKLDQLDSNWRQLVAAREKAAEQKAQESQRRIQEKQNQLARIATIFAAASVISAVTDVQKLITDMSFVLPILILLALCLFFYFLAAK
ncbi:MAG: GNAT family N-acetyltransferase [Gammaproteobacteria bacterium]